jgi:hypothetical protein
MKCPFHALKDIGMALFFSTFANTRLNKTPAMRHQIRLPPSMNCSANRFASLLKPKLNPM